MHWLGIFHCLTEIWMVVQHSELVSGEICWTPIFHGSNQLPGYAPWEFCTSVGCGRCSPPLPRSRRISPGERMVEHGGTLSIGWNRCRVGLQDGNRSRIPFEEARRESVWKRIICTSQTSLKQTFSSHARGIPLTIGIHWMIWYLIPPPTVSGFRNRFTDLTWRKCNWLNKTDLICINGFVWK